MKHFSTLVTAVWLTGALAAQESIQTHDPLTQAWQRFAADPLSTDGSAAGAWQSVWNKATGTPKAIYGPGLRVKRGRVADLSEARALAADLLDARADLLGRGDSRFVESTAQKVRQVYVLVYDQTFAGLSVIGGRADVRLHDSGVVSMFGSQAVQIPAGFATVPQVKRDYAWALAHDHLSVQPAVGIPGEAAPNATLVIHADVEARAAAVPQLAWQVQVDVRSADSVTVGKVYVDARTGQVIEFVDEVYRCWMGHDHVRGEASDHGEESLPVAKGHLGKLLAEARAGGSAAAAAAPMAAVTGNVRSWLNRGLSPLTPLTNQTLQGIRVSIAGGGSAFTDANGDFSIPHGGTAPVSVSANFGSGSGQRMSGGITFNTGSAVSGSATITPGTPGQIQMLTAGAGETSWSQPTVFWHVDDVNRWVEGLTGGYSGTRFNIGAMRGVVNISSSCNAFYTGNSINFYNRGGSCNMTAFSSVIYHEWGHGVDDAFGGISQTDGLSEAWGDILSLYRLGDPIIGRDFTTSGGFVRTALNNTQYPPGGFPSGGAPHPKGECYMGWAWTVRANLIASLGAQAGAATAEQIVVGSLPADATNQPDAVREVFILDDDDGNLNNGVPHYTELANACRSRSLPFPEIQVGSISHTPVGSTTEAFTPQIARAVVAPISGSFQSVDIVFDTGSGPVRRPMVPSGATANEYLALLPGVPAPSRVSYHLEAGHSTNITLRFPENGSLSYSVGNDAVVFSENFDSGSPGWQSFQVARQDDWQNGTPNGASGSSSGVAWSDPSSAVSGSSVYGNDLAPAGFNGAYQPNVHNLLRSPVINLAGESGVKLRFKRWLTVEEGIYDQAQIRVNGQVVWQNPANGNLVDTSWQDFELAIPTADNNPSVQVEFRLITDGGLNLGGWNIDDFEVLAARQVQPPAVRFTLTPSQIPAGGSAVLALAGDPSVPAAVLISDSEGPTNLPGLPELSVGTINLLVLPVATDANGDYSITVPGSVNPNDVGMLLYTQAIQVVNGQVEVSNKGRLLFGN